MPESLFFLDCNFIKRHLFWRGCVCGSRKPSFVPHLIFNWCTFSRRITARWSRGWAKNQVLTNQNSRNSWCQIVRELYVTEHLRWLLLKKDGCRRRDINIGIFYNKKGKKSSIAKKVVREIFLLYHSLLFVVTGCHSLPLVVPLVVPLAVTQFTARLSFYKRSFLYCFIRLKI